MYKKAWSTCKVVVLRNKLLAFLTSCLPSPWSLLKLPIDTFRRSSVLFETPACYHSNDRYLTFNPINVMCYRCILSTTNLNFILVTKTPMNGNNSQPTKLSSASLRLRFSLTRKSRNHHHTRWCSARKLYIPWPWCVWSVCCSLWMTKHRGCYLFYSVVQLNIAESETFSSSRANGWRIMNNLKLLVKYFDARWTGDILSSYLCFLQVDIKSEVLSGRAKAIHELL